MKKFIATGIISLGGLGLLGMGATAASAATGPTANQQVCTSAQAQFNSLKPAIAAATATQGVDASTADTALGAVGTAESAYIKAAFVVINDVDSAATSAQQAVDVSSFNATVTSFVNAVVASSQANVAAFNAAATVTQLNLQSTVLQDMGSHANPVCTLS